MEATKRTYQKHKTEKKITIKHYLNISNNHESFLHTQLFPVYVQVTYKQKTTKFKCKYSYFDEDEIPDYPKHNNLQDFQEYYCKPIDDDYIYYSIGEDKYFSRDFQFIKWLVNTLIEVNKDKFDISQLPQLYHSNLYRLDYFIFWCLKMEILSILVKEYGVDSTKTISRIHNGSILECLEYFIKKYPKLEVIKEKYQSQIWYFGVYTDLGYEVEPEENSDEYFMFSFVNKDDMRELEKPNIVDYLSGTFQKRFADCFEDKKVISDIIGDIDRLFSKHYQFYLKEFFSLDK